MELMGAAAAPVGEVRAPNAGTKAGTKSDAGTDGTSGADLDPETIAQLPRNAPCPCGSGLKVKQCHGKVA
ncbi:MAG: SEC-C metal-binding domain-containing protein, partial [Litorimonas sp.]